MTMLETLVAMVAIAILLLQVTRRLRLPYPGVLAGAGVGVAMLPGAPDIPIDPGTALALFIAPVLIDAAYDFPLSTVRRMALPLFLYTVVAVVATTVVVVVISVTTIGLPIAAAVVLGAIISPPDAAASTAVLSTLSINRRVEALLKGESLFNDATALLLFGTALTVVGKGALDTSTAMKVAIAVPGGILFGIAMGLLVSKFSRLTSNTVGGILLQFVYAFSTWLLADRLHLSAVLATVASAMTVASVSKIDAKPNMRVHSFAVWTTVVFLLNILAFLLMGLQARRIVEGMSASDFHRAVGFGSIVVAGIVVARLAIAFAFHTIVVFRHRRGANFLPFSFGETFLVGWAGMRGLVTLATALALPTNFPDRDLVVLTAFFVVLATLVIQGASLVPLIRFFKLGRINDAREESQAAKVALAQAALDRLENEAGPEAEAVRMSYLAICENAGSRDGLNPFERRRHLLTAAISAQRNRLEELRICDRIGQTEYLVRQQELDWMQLGVSSDEDRGMKEN